MSQRKVALALGAGGARGLAQILALEALDELGVKPSLIVGSSCLLYTSDAADE